jgi:hypothetical protein
MTRFTSKHFPRSANPLILVQETAMRYYAGFAMVLMVFLIVRASEQRDILWFGVLGFAGCIALGNIAAIASIRKKMGQIFFVNDSFTILSVYDISFGKNKPSFPIELASVQYHPNSISFHYFDRIIELKRDEWEQIDLIATYLKGS